MSNAAKHIAIITCCSDDWGGSEELWAKSVPLLLQQDYQVTVYKKDFNFAHPCVAELLNKGIHLVSFKPRPPGVTKKFINKIRRYFVRNPNPINYNNEHVEALGSLLQKNKPDLVLINQAINFDGMGYAYQCLMLGIRYAMISHKAVDFFWPYHTERPYMIEAWKKAIACFFVSAHNQRITEEQFGFRLTQASLIWNPVKFNRNITPFPETKSIYKLACIGRFFVLDKGQDMLIKILSQEPWRSRPVEVTFIGGGPDEAALKDLAQLLDVKNIHFLNYQSDVAALWETHHALVLPSRSEGMPLVTIEAMAIGRPVIVTTAGGHPEIIRHGINGYIGGATEKDFASTMEDAWNNRSHWDRIGKQAHDFITQHIPQNPETLFSNAVSKLIQ
jgi:glycosyltransferase involved in cell wall biosynthesis